MGTESTTAAARLAVLRARIPAPVGTGTGGATRERHRRYSLALPATVAAVGVAARATGGALYGVSGQRYDNINPACGVSMMCDASQWGSTRNLERAGIGLLIAGGVLVAVDVGLWAGWVAR